MCGEHIIIGTGVENIDFSKVISLNESAAWLWREVEGKEFTPATLAALLMEQYDVDEAVALIGTSNLDYRSLYHHFECAAYLYRLPVLQDIQKWNSAFLPADLSVTVVNS